MKRENIYLILKLFFFFFFKGDIKTLSYKPLYKISFLVIVNMRFFLRFFFAPFPICRDTMQF
jgi:hypothetical protein